MPSHRVIRLDAAGCDALARVLGDTPETVIAVQPLRQRLCSAYAVGDLGRPDAAVIQPTLRAEEPMAFGTDAGAIWRVLADLSGRACVNVDNAVACRLGPIVEAHLGRSVRYLGDVYHTLDRPAGSTYPHVLDPVRSNVGRPPLLPATHRSFGKP